MRKPIFRPSRWPLQTKTAAAFAAAETRVDGRGPALVGQHAGDKSGRRRHCAVDAALELAVADAGTISDGTARLDVAIVQAELAFRGMRGLEVVTELEVDFAADLDRLGLRQGCGAAI